MASNVEFKKQMNERLKSFALRLIRMYQALPKTGEASVIGKQVLRSGTSVVANYRAACRARSEKEYFSKLSIEVEEAGETELWLSLLIEAEIVSKAKLGDLYQEAIEILKIMSSTDALNLICPINPIKYEKDLLSI